MFLLFYIFSITFGCLQTSTETSKCGPLYITVEAEKNVLQVNWEFTCKKVPDKLILYKNDTTDDSKQIKEINIKNNFYGFEDTKEVFKISNFPGNWNQKDSNPTTGTHCLPYYVVSYCDDNIVDSQCLPIQPTWMEKFGNLRIGKIFIPGTHNSGTYKANIIVERWIMNQKHDFWVQLVFGIRYFDIRVGNSKKGFTINHGKFSCVPLEPELKKVLRFIKMSPKEIVILDFHRFIKFNDNLHNKLIQLIKDIFGDFIFQLSSSEHKDGPTLEKMWSNNKRIVIHYNEEQPYLPNEIIYRKWGNKQDTKSLRKYLKSVGSSRDHKHIMNVLMAEITPDLITGLKYSLKDLANMFNPYLSMWMEADGYIKDVNVVAVDFFLSSDIVLIAILENEKKISKLRS